MSMVPEPEFDPEELANALVLTVAALLRTPTIRQALHDLLRTYGLTAQIAEIMGHQHNHVQALAEAIIAFHSKLLDHDKMALSNYNTIISLLNDLNAHIDATTTGEVE